MSPSWIEWRKEARALVAAWAAAAVSLAALARLSNDRDGEFGWVAFFVGALTLAALSIGHEYSHGTLPILLSLPVRRSHLLLVKLGALIPMVMLLWIVAMTVLPPTTDFGPSAFPLLALLCGLVSAPWLTMVCRGPLAGVLFAGAITGLAHTVAGAAVVGRYGWSDDRTADQAAFHDAVLLAGLLCTTAFATVAGWRRFMRLEAVGGAAAGLDLDRWMPTADSSAAAPAAHRTHRHPLWLLTLKELRLQRLTMVVAVVIAVGRAAMALLWRNNPNALDILDALVLFCYGSLAVLIGSLASAEERHMGTLEAQLLLPMAGRQQWMAKLGTSLSLALLVSVVTPTLMVDVSRLSLWHAGIVVLLTVGSLYVSSLCRSGLQALTWSVPVLVVALLLLGSRLAPSRLGPWISTEGSLVAGALATAAAAAVWFGLENHRSTTPDIRRVGSQAMWIAAGPIAAVIIARWW
jgi:hypothetical protein